MVRWFLGVLAAAIGFCAWPSKKADEGVSEVLPVESSGAPVTESTEDSVHLTPQLELKSAKRNLIQGKQQEIINHYRAGDYGTALRLIEQEQKATKESSYLSWLQDQLPVVLTSLAWTLIHRGACSEAIPLLARSESLSPLWQTRKGLAFCYVQSKQLNDAEYYLEQYLEAVPGDKDMQLLLVEVLETQGRFAEALEIMEGMDTAGFDPAAKEVFELRLDSMRSRYRQSYRQFVYDTKNFQLTFPEDLFDSMSVAVAEFLEVSLVSLTDYFGFAYPKAPIEVVFYKSKQFGEAVSYSPGWAGGIYDGRIRIQLQGVYATDPYHPRLRRLMRHELVHALFDGQLGSRRLPAWFNESIAMYLECGEGCDYHDFTPLPIPGRFLQAEEFSQSFTAAKSARAEALYSQSFHMLKVLIHHGYQGAHQNLAQLISKLKKDSVLDSDSLLEPLGVEFEYIYRMAARSWPPRESGR